MVVTDTRPGSAEDLWLCSWAIALAAAAPSGGCSFLPDSALPPPPSRPWDGTTRTPFTIRTTQSVSLARWVFLRFFASSRPMRSPPHAHAALPPRGLPFVPPGLWPGRALCPPPSTLHTLSPGHISVIPPGGAALWCVPPLWFTRHVYAAICPLGLRPACRGADTLAGIPHKSSMGTRLAGEALPLRVRGPGTPPLGRCGFVSTAAVASRPQTPGPRPSPRQSRAPALLVRTDWQSGIRQPGHRQVLGVTTSARPHPPGLE